MLSTLEQRVLYLLHKRDGRAKLTQLSEALHRFSKQERHQSLVNLETMGLISSGKTPPTLVTGGRGGLVYWLTSEGAKYVEDQIDTGKLPGPKQQAALQAERYNHVDD